MSGDPEAMADVCAELGITIEAIPSTDPPHDPTWIADGWRVTLTLEGRTLTTPYWCGVGHREWGPMETLRDGSRGASVQSLDFSSQYTPAQSLDFSSQYTPAKGWRRVTSPKELPSYIRPTLHNVEHARFRPKPPSAADVLSSLCLDAAGVAFGQTFEDWCAEYGSDPDSRKAEATYRACQNDALRLRGFLGAHYDRVCAAEH